MYSVSEEYLTKMLDQIQTHKLSGTIDGVSFDESNVIGVSINNRCAEKKVNLGSVNIGTLKLTFLTDILNRGEYYGKTIILKPCRAKETARMETIYGYFMYEKERGGQN